MLADREVSCQTNRRRDHKKRHQFAAAMRQLKRGFRASERWVSDKRHRDAMSGFGKGEDWGATILTDFMPTWFESWYNSARWIKTGLTQGQSGFISLVRAFEMPWDSFLRQLKILIPCHLEYYAVSLAECEKPAVVAFMADRRRRRR